MLEQPQTGLISRFYRQVENRLKKLEIWPAHLFQIVLKVRKSNFFISIYSNIYVNVGHAIAGVVCGGHQAEGG